MGQECSKVEESKVEKSKVESAGARGNWKTVMRTGPRRREGGGQETGERFSTVGHKRGPPPPFL